MNLLASITPAEATLAAAGAAALLGLLALVAVLVAAGRLGRRVEHVRLLAEQGLAGQRGEAERLRAALADAERAITASGGEGAAQLRQELSGALSESRAALDSRLGGLREGNEARLSDIQQTLNLQLTALDRRLVEMREGNETKLAAIQKTVNEQLHEAVEKQMTTSFQRVTEQFAAVQKAMGDVQAVTAQIGDLKRLFGNVKTRGGWGETQVRAMLDDILPVGAYEVNWKPRATGDEAVEFAVVMPLRGGTRVFLPVDAKFPVEDYERLLTARDSADEEGERQAGRGLERAVREQAKRIAEKYIAPPATVDFAVMYLPTDGLYAEVARMPGLIDDLGRLHRVLVMGPTLFPALLRTIHLGHLTLTLEAKAGEIGKLLSATKTEMEKIDGVLDALSKQAGTFSNTIERARVRTRAMGRTLKGIQAANPMESAQLLGIEAEEVAEDEGG